jgi:hypothetical protein
MYKLINGWTKETVMAQVKKYNDGTRSIVLWDDKEQCSYEDERGNRCAVGCFIPDMHKALMDIKCASDTVANHQDLWKLVPFDGDTLDVFQRTHDRADKTHDGDVYRAIQEFLDARVA